MARIQKPRSCSNCRFSDNRSENDPCIYCLGLADYPHWKSRRGAKAGADRKEGAGRKRFEDRSELKQSIVLSFKVSDITKSGGYKKVKSDLEKWFYNMAKQSLARRCMYCEKEMKKNEAIVLCKECTK